MAVPSCAPSQGESSDWHRVLVALGWEQRGWRSSAGLSTAGIPRCNLSCPKICQLWCVWL